MRSFGPAAMFSREKESWNSPEPGAAWIDYCSYSLSSREWIQYGIAGFLLAAVINFLFFRQRIAFIFLSPLILIIPLRMKKTLMERRQQELVRQFRDGALAVASALGCGYSIENAFSQAAESMSAVYGEDGYITLEFEWICSRLALNQTVEEEIRSLAVRSGQEDIRQFAEVFGAAKRSSGDLSAILQDTAELLGRKIQLREEIRTMIAAKRLEQNMMCLMPAAVLIYIELTNPGYTDVLYQGVAGHLIMTVCLGVYVLAIWWGRKILDIEI